MPWLFFWCSPPISACPVGYPLPPVLWGKVSGCNGLGGSYLLKSFHINYLYSKYSFP